MCAISINVPEEVLLNLHENQEDFTDYMQKMLALDLYKNKKVSLGYCASIAEMTEEDFIKYLGMNGLSIFSFDSKDEFMEELANA
jgi:predicted HTH domain antitoxin